MLTESQANRVWERMVEAEVRSLYFADLANRYTRRKQILTGLSFFLSSGAAATIVAKTPTWVPLLLAVIVALATAYSMAVSLDRYIGGMTKLHYGWNHLAVDYERLWNHWRDDDAERIFEELVKQGMEMSEQATEMPYHEKLIDKWREIVYSRFREDTDLPKKVAAVV
jgi:hypothetical protein